MRPVVRRGDAGGQFGLPGALPRHADGPQGNAYNVQQSTECKSHDLNIDILGVVGLLNGVLGSGVNGEGDSGAQSTHLGSEMGCNNSAF